MNDPLKYYVPTGAQEDIIKAIVGASKEYSQPKILCMYGNKTGKDYTTFELLLHMIDSRRNNGWMDYDIFNNFPYPKRILYCSEPTILKDELVPTFNSLLVNFTEVSHSPGVGEFRRSKGQKAYYSKYEFERGFILDFKSFEDAPESYEGRKLGFCVLSESAPDEINRRVAGRLVLGGITVYVMTPLYVEPYILDDVGMKADNQERGYRKLIGDVYSACKRRGIRGYLDAKILDDWVKSLTPEEREARVMGRPMYYSQMIFSDLDHKLHFVDPKEYPLQPNYLYYVVINPHEGRETPVIFACKTPQGRHIIFDELPTDTIRHLWQMTSSPTVKEVANEIKFKESEYKIHPTRIIDKYMGGQKRGGEGKNLIDRYVGEGLGFIKSYSSSSKEGEIAYGHEKISQLLKILPDGKPGLVIWNTCYHTWDGLSHYIKIRLTTKAGSDVPARAGKIGKKAKLMTDNVRYFVCSSGEKRIKKEIIRIPKQDDFFF